MSYQNLLLERDGAVATLTVNRPAKLNALNHATIDELAAAFDAIEADVDLHAVVLTGAGDKAFVAGADISEINSLTPNEALGFARRGQHLMRRIELFPKPVIAAVNGFALGGGCELALACTLRMAASTARIGLPEIKLGIMPGFGGTQRVARQAGRAAALELALTGEPITAERAYQLGLVHRISEPADLLSDARTLAATLARQAPVAMSHIITAVSHGAEIPLDQALDMECQLFSLCCATEDMQEGTRAFLEKRKATFSGR